MKRLLATPGRGAVPSPPGYIDMEGVKELVVTSPTAYRGCRGLTISKQKGAPKVTDNYCLSYQHL